MKKIGKSLQTGLDANGKLDVVEFGRRLVETGDLDPVYIALWNAQFPLKKLQKFLLAYFCFYHMGTASWITDQPDYWKAMETAVSSSNYRRGTERRHFRGEAAKKSVAWLWSKGGGVQALFNEFDRARLNSRVLTLTEVMTYVQTWVGFGPWIAFKVADMLERLDLCQISFTEADTFLFKSPKEGAQLVLEKYGPIAEVRVDYSAAWALNYLEKHLGELKAPPRYERTLNGQEYETILCKWKSHLGGHYEVGHDLEEIREGLQHYLKSRTAQALLKALRDVRTKENPQRTAVGSRDFSEGSETRLPRLSYLSR